MSRRNRKYLWKLFLTKWSNKDDMYFSPPILVGALGGSGTRAVATILRRSGVFMGNWVDARTEDSQSFRVFLTRWFNHLLEEYFLENGNISTEVATHFLDAVRVHRLGLSSGQLDIWGWKNPRNMWLLPFYVKFFPNLKFIHIVRDGRDMALSTNNNLLNHSGDVILGPHWRNDLVYSQLELWRVGNLYARENAINLLGERNYLLLKYEEICQQPDASIARLLSFIGLPADTSLTSELSKLIVPSKRIGDGADPIVSRAVSQNDAVRLALNSFGYDA